MSTRKHRHGAMRLVSAVLAFALVMAHVIGGYAHAAGHHAAAGDVAASAYHSCHDSSTPVVAATDAGGQDDQSQGSSGPAAHFDACDFMCHGGVAILVTPCFSYTHAKGPPASTVADAVHLLLPVSLERPPRSVVRA